MKDNLFIRSGLAPATEIVCQQIIPGKSTVLIAGIAVPFIEFIGEVDEYGVISKALGHSCCG
jgi:hypothetical protein